MIICNTSALLAEATNLTYNEAECLMNEIEELDIELNLSDIDDIIYSYEFDDIRADYNVPDYIPDCELANYVNELDHSGNYYIQTNHSVLEMR